MFAICGPDRKKRDFIGAADGERWPRGCLRCGELRLRGCPGLGELRLRGCLGGVHLRI